MRLIDADAIRYDRLLKTGNKEHPLEWAASQSRIDNVPTIDAEPVRHGHWKESSTCSVCGKRAVKKVIFCDETLWEDKYDYCPHCGAKMDEVEE